MAAIGKDVPVGSDLPQRPVPPSGNAVTTLERQAHTESLKAFEADAEKVLRQFQTAVERFNAGHRGHQVSWTLQVIDMATTKGDGVMMTLQTLGGSRVAATFPADRKPDLARVVKGRFVQITGSLGGCSLDTSGQDRYGWGLAWPEYANRRLTIALDAQGAKPLKVAVAAVMDTHQPTYLLYISKRPQPVLMRMVNALDEQDRLLVIVAKDSMVRLPSAGVVPATEANRKVVEEGTKYLGPSAKPSLAQSIGQAVGAVGAKQADLLLVTVFASEMDARTFEDVTRMLPSRTRGVCVQVWLKEAALPSVPEQFRDTLEASGGHLRTY